MVGGREINRGLMRNVAANVTKWMVAQATG